MNFAASPVRNKSVAKSRVPDLASSLLNCRRGFSAIVDLLPLSALAPHPRAFFSITLCFHFYSSASLPQQENNEGSNRSEKNLHDWNLHMYAANLFGNPKFLDWIYYAEVESPQDNGKWADILVKKIRPDYLCQTIKAGMESLNEDIQTLAKHLQLTRYEILTKKNNFSPIDTFKEIKVDVDKLFAHPLFQQWYNYCKHQLNYEDSAIAFAMWKNSDTEDLLSALDRGKEVKSTKELATKLYAGLLKHFGEPSSAPIKIFFANNGHGGISGKLTLPSGRISLSRMPTFQRTRCSSMLFEKSIATLL